MDVPPRLLTIGEFSRISRLSVRMLRYYDGHGLLNPEWTDPSSGYRYYSGMQLDRAQQITMLRDMGCPVSRIAELLPLFGDADALHDALAVQRAHLEGEVDRLTSQIREVERLCTYLKESSVSIEIRLIDVPEYTAASLRDTIPTFADETQLWERLIPAMGAAGAVPAGPDGPPISSAYFHDTEYRDADVDVEARMSVAAPFESVPDATCITVPAHRALSAILHGGFDGMPAIMSALGAEVTRRGLNFDGTMYNVYVYGPGITDDQTQWITDVRIPVEG